MGYGIQHLLGTDEYGDSEWEDVNDENDKPLRFDTAEEANAYIGREPFCAENERALLQWSSKAGFNETKKARQLRRQQVLEDHGLWEPGCLQPLHLDRIPDRPQLPYIVVAGENMNVNLEDWARRPA